MKELNTAFEVILRPKLRDIFAALMMDNTEEVKALLARGADPNATMGGGHTPLQAAANRGNVEAVCILLDNGADLEAKNDCGFTALIAAVYQGKVDVVRLLIEKGAALDERESYDGSTALIIATADGHVEIVRLLIDGLADINKQNDTGETALSYAECFAGRDDDDQDKYGEIIQLLKDAPARQEEIICVKKELEMHERIAIKQRKFKAKAGSRMAIPGSIT